MIKILNKNFLSSASYQQVFQKIVTKVEQKKSKKNFDEKKFNEKKFSEKRYTKKN